MATYDRRVVVTRRVEFAVPTNTHGAPWSEVMKAIYAARQELVTAGKLTDGEEPSDDEIRLHSDDEAVIVAIEASEIEEDGLTSAWGKALQAKADRMHEALMLIAENNGNGTDNHCSNYTGGSATCRKPNSGRTKDAEYGADRWCDACIAADGLGLPA